jgi:hypothetical protein
MNDNDRVTSAEECRDAVFQLVQRVPMLSEDYQLLMRHVVSEQGRQFTPLSVIAASPHR